VDEHDLRAVPFAHQDSATGQEGEPPGRVQVPGHDGRLEVVLGHVRRWRSG
jgi:hypothetical protein